jgi:hypothetical protein
MQHDTKTYHEEETIKCFFVCNLTKKIKVQYGFLKFLFVFSHGLLVIKQQKNEIVKYIILHQIKLKKSSIWILEIFICFFSWSLGYQTKKNEIVKYIITSSNQTQKKTIIIFVKIRNRETGKRLRELEVIVSVKAREVKRERERRKNIIYTKNSSYLHWVIQVGSS